MILIVSNAVNAQRSLVENPLEYAESHLWSGGTNVVLEGATAYALTVSGLMVIDISDSIPRKIAEVYLYKGHATDICIRNDLAYVTALEGGFFVINLQSFQVIGEFTLPQNTHTVDIQDSLAYVGYGLDAGDKGLLILDVSDPANIAIADSLPTEIIPRKVRIRDGLAYVAGHSFMAGGKALLVDLSGPAIIAQHSTPGYLPIDLDLQDTLLFLASLSAFWPPSNSELTILSTNLSPVGSLSFPGGVSDVNVSGSLAVVANDWAVRFVNIADPASPAETGHYQVAGNVAKLDMEDSTIFVLDNDDFAGSFSFRLLSTTMQQIWHFPLPRVINKVVPGNNCVFAIGPEIRAVYPNNFQEGSSYLPNGEPEDAALEGSVLYVAGSAGLELVDVSDPNNMQHIRNYTTGFALDVMLLGNYAYVAAGSNIYVIDITDPNDSPVAVVSTGDLAIEMAVSGSYLYVAAKDASGCVFDITSPEDPQFVRNFGSNLYNGIAVAGNRLYVETSTEFETFDVTDRANPVFLSRTPVSDVRDLLPLGGYLVVADGSNGVKVFDVTAPEPVLFYSIQTPGFSVGLCATNDYLFVADKNSLILFHNGVATSVEEHGRLPQSFVLHQNYPNPFNAATNIMYILNRPSYVKLSVYNILGQEIDVLVAGRKSSGLHQARWDASMFASGIYFYRLEIDDSTSSRRMVLSK